jgi:uncharacterized protein involved in tellurium resistance
LWSGGIDAAVNWHDEKREHLNDKIYFFKGHQYMRFDISKNSVDNGYPMTVKSGWNGLEKGILASNSVLREKNQISALPEILNLNVKLRWFKSIDIDIAVVYVLKNGSKGIVYFGNKGSLDQAPFVWLNKDAMFDDENEEIIRIKDLSLFSELYIICWDFSNSMGTGVFDDADVNISIIDNNNNSTSVFLNQETGKDAACIAKVFYDGVSYKVENTSKYFKRNGDSNPDRILEKIKS